MSRQPYNSIFKKQQKTLIPATFKKGFISSVNAGSLTANIYFQENPSTIIRGVPLAKHINLTTAYPGARCRVDVFNEQNADNMVIAYIW